MPNHAFASVTQSSAAARSRTTKRAPSSSTSERVDSRTSTTHRPRKKSLLLRNPMIPTRPGRIVVHES
ncbi:hypothetical protein ASE12_12665 [Aeromicrobium sp. Root236]|nr:hypothetical protein ASE12_12665 [Aeromicrobium sp. Root236]